MYFEENLSLLHHAVFAGINHRGTTVDVVGIHHQGESNTSLQMMLTQSMHALRKESGNRSLQFPQRQLQKVHNQVPHLQATPTIIFSWVKVI